MNYTVTAVLDVPATADVAEAAVDALAGHSPAASTVGDRLSVTVSVESASLTDAVAEAAELLSGALPYVVLSVEAMTSVEFDRRTFEVFATA